MLIDSYGWVDDVRALPGECGSEISRRIYLHSLMKQGTNLQQLKQMGFSKEMVADMNKQLVREEYGPKVGDCQGNTAYKPCAMLFGQMGLPVVPSQTTFQNKT